MVKLSERLVKINNSRTYAAGAKARDAIALTLRLDNRFIDGGVVYGQISRPIYSNGVTTAGRQTDDRKIPHKSAFEMYKKNECCFVGTRNWRVGPNNVRTAAPVWPPAHGDDYRPLST